MRRLERGAGGAESQCSASFGGCTENKECVYERMLHAVCTGVDPSVCVRVGPSVVAQRTKSAATERRKRWTEKPWQRRDHWNIGDDELACRGGCRDACASVTREVKRESEKRGARGRMGRCFPVITCSVSEFSDESTPVQSRIISAHRCLHAHRVPRGRFAIGV